MRQQLEPGGRSRAGSKAGQEREQARVKLGAQQERGRSRARAEQELSDYLFLPYCGEKKKPIRGG